MSYLAGKEVSAKISGYKVSSDITPSGETDYASTGTPDWTIPWVADDVDSNSDITLSSGSLVLPAGDYWITTCLGVILPTGDVSSYGSGLGFPGSLNTQGFQYQKYPYLEISWFDENNNKVGVPFRLGDQQYTHTITGQRDGNGSRDNEGYLSLAKNHLKAVACLSLDAQKTLSLGACGWNHYGFKGTGNPGTRTNTHTYSYTKPGWSSVQIKLLASMCYTTIVEV